ncbi:uncharacterized protein LOC117639525 [Thrips palmi]|uniref:Uncharacterized protein LOC117639525 n=1 Tax=Thrips palmi TaxID=161013 RepID=A0A6P8YBR7_THRPL|nr:uncharacterized protein LOC117639525 [Thrips palmi]
MTHSCASILLWVSVASVSAANHINSYAGPFDIHFKEALQCPQGTVTAPLLMNMSGTLLSSRTLNGMVYNGVAFVARKVTKGDVGVKLAIAKWDNVAGWRENYFRLDGGEVCFAMKTVGKDAMAELHRNNPRFPTGCPLPDGSYSFRNFSTAALSRYEHFPVFPYGRFRGDLGFYDMKSKEVAGCISGISEVVPKLKNKNKK